MMKLIRFFSATVALCLLVGLASPVTFATVAEEKPYEGVTIDVFNWGLYISDGSDGYIDVNKAFTEKTGIKVNYMAFESNEAMYAKLKTGGVNYDVVIPSDYMVARLIEEDMLAPLNFDNIPNYALVDPEFKNQAYDPDNLYSVPYTWGTVGLIYNTKYVTEEVKGWDLMWNAAYADKILMFDNPRDSFAIAQFKNGIDINTEDPQELMAAADDLKLQKPVVQQYVMDQIFDKMVNEEAYVGAYYAGDYLTMVQDNENLAFVFPEEGFNMFIDAMCIPKNAAHKEAAEAYINFLSSPEISGENMEYLGYSTPISAAKEFMDPEVANSEIAYPSAETLARATSFSSLSQDTLTLMDKLWLEVKTDGSAGGGSTTLIMIGVAVVLVIVVALFLANQSKKKKMAARKKVTKR